MKLDNKGLEALMALIHNSSFETFIKILDEKAEGLRARNRIPTISHREADMNIGAEALIDDIKSVCNLETLKGLKMRSDNNRLTREIVNNDTPMIG
jgi:hypothetical protein